MMIRDRGNIKWNAMMLPEHVNLLREWHEKDDYVKKPELDEWALQELSEQLQIAYHNNAEVELGLWEDNHIFKATGIISTFNVTKGTLSFEDGRKFPFYSIFSITYSSVD